MKGRWKTILKITKQNLFHVTSDQLGTADRSRQLFSLYLLDKLSDLWPRRCQKQIPQTLKDASSVHRSFRCCATIWWMTFIYSFSTGCHGRCPACWSWSRPRHQSSLTQQVRVLPESTVIYINYLPYYQRTSCWPIFTLKPPGADYPILLQNNSPEMMHLRHLRHLRVSFQFRADLLLLSDKI